ncbi:TetR/AcrR family transcriptional regulator [Rhizobium sp. YIM 134829]|uniref:TetR/AcrR family transcriptional regulator n=1 Tax=Rhizobium sp. YIM 134829 TaxID=3390453 RepID=UPI003979BD18
MARTQGAGQGRRSRSGRSGGAAGEGALSLDRIIEAAIALLDADGLDGLSMRRLADRLGAGAMSLYWHVESKDAVLDLALDAVLRAEAADPEGDADWLLAIHAELHGWRSAMLLHPWSAALLARRALGAATLGRLERLLLLLSAGGIAPDRLNAAVWALWNMTVGASVTRASFVAGQGDEAGAGRSTALPDTHPAIAASNLLGEADWDKVFEEGVGRLLSGFLQTEAPAGKA